MKKGGVNPFIHKSEKKNTIQDHETDIRDAGLKCLLKYQYLYL